MLSQRLLEEILRRSDINDTALTKKLEFNNVFSENELCDLQKGFNVFRKGSISNNLGGKSIEFMM